MFMIMRATLQGNFVRNASRRSAIKVIAFDFWDVFADLDHPMYVYMKKHGVDPERYSQSIHDLIIAHDLGKMTEKEFLRESSRIIGLKLPYELCHLTFREELLNKRLIGIVKKLKRKYKLILLTNNSKEYCQAYLFETKLNRLFDDLIISYKVGFRKPSPEMYQLLIRRARVSPEEILFVDDSALKFAAAEGLGINTLQYKKGATDEILVSLAKSKFSYARRQ